ncbi:MAG: YveK family protein [Clostridium sp.]
MEQTISIKDLVLSIAKRWKMILIITILVTASAAAISIYAIKPLYQSKIKLFVGKEGAEASYNNSDITMFQNLLKTYSEIIKTDQLVKNSIEGHPISKTSKEILPNITVVPRQDTQIIEILYKSDKKQETEQIVTLVAEEFVKEAKALIPNSNVQIIEKARTPGGPISPNIKMNIMIAFLLSIMVGVGLALLLEFMDNTIKSEKDAEEVLGISILGTVSVEEFSDSSKEHKLSRKEKRNQKKIRRQEEKNKKRINKNNEVISLTEKKQSEAKVLIETKEIENKKSGQATPNTKDSKSGQETPNTTDLKSGQATSDTNNIESKPEPQSKAISGQESSKITNSQESSEITSDKSINDLQDSNPEQAKVETTNEQEQSKEIAEELKQEKVIVPRSKRNKKRRLFRKEKKAYDTNAGESQ